MELSIKNSDEKIVATLVGRLDTAASVKFATDMQPLMDAADKHIVLDCEKLEFISSSGLRLFLSLRKAAASKGGKIIVKAINNDIRSVFMMTGFLNLFEIQD